MTDPAFDLSVRFAGRVNAALNPPPGENPIGAATEATSIGLAIDFLNGDVPVGDPEETGSAFRDGFRLAKDGFRLTFAISSGSYEFKIEDRPEAFQSVAPPPARRALIATAILNGFLAGRREIDAQVAAGRRTYRIDRLGQALDHLRTEADGRSPLGKRISSAVKLIERVRQDLESERRREEGGE